MWYVEYKMLDGGEVHKWVGLTKDQALEIYKKYGGWQGKTSYTRCGRMETQ